MKNMTVRELIEKLEAYADKHGDNIPVRTFNLDRVVCDIRNVELWRDYNLECYIYIGV